METLKKVLWILGIVGVVLTLITLLHLSLTQHTIITNQKLIMGQQQQYHEDIEELKKMEKGEKWHELKQ